MGDIKRIHKKYQKPGHPWNKERIDAEKVLVRAYGLRNKKELWRAETILKNIKDQIKSFPSMPAERAEERAEKLRLRLLRLGIIKEDTNLRDVLGLSTDSILNRRLQTILFNKGLARSCLQARQFIVHEHVQVNGRTVSSPSYLVRVDEEMHISFNPSSSFISDTHPERVPVEKQETKVKITEPEPDIEPEVVELTEEDVAIE